MSELLQDDLRSSLCVRAETEATARPARLRLYFYAGLTILALTVTALILRSGDTLRYFDEGAYVRLAQSIVHANVYEYRPGRPSVERPPGYPAVIAAVFTLSERPLAAKLANALFLTVAVAVLAAATRRLDPRAGSLLPYLALAQPLLLYATTLIYPQTLGCMLLAIAVYVLTGPQLKREHAVLAGLVLGTLILAIPSFLLLLPVFGLYIALRGSDGAIRWARALLLMMAAGLVIAPWTVRNYVTFGALIPVSANSGSNLLIGNSPVSGPNSGVMADVVPLCKRWHHGMSDYAYDHAMQQCAVDWITQHPRAAATLYARKVVNYFNYRNPVKTAGESSAWRDRIAFITYYALLVCVLVRLAVAARQPLASLETLIYVLYFLNAFASAIFFTRVRFRIPFDFLLLAVAAVFLVRTFARSGAQRPDTQPYELTDRAALNVY
jgi:hypothetical protein